MRVILKPGLLVLSVEDEAEQLAFDRWRAAAAGHVFQLATGSPKGCALHDLGPRADACREPVNILFDAADRWQPISNLAQTPFTLRGSCYASVEGFWQGLKFPDERTRRRIGMLWGKAAKRVAEGLPTPDTFVYDGDSYVVGGAAHHGLMLEACRAKFGQNPAARDALLATGDRPLVHRVRRDSRAIPAALLADIWMRVRAGERAVARAA